MRLLRSIALLLVLTAGGLPAPAQEPAAAEAPPVDLDAVVDALSLENLLGQTLMVGFEPGGHPERSLEQLSDLIRRYRIGNVILYEENLPRQYDVVDPLSIPRHVAELTGRLQEVAHEFSGLPLFIAVDQEGAPQDPINTGVTDIPDHIQLGAARSERLALQAGCVVGSELSAMGVNMVLAPVADINTTNDNDFIGRRSFGAHRDLVRPLAVRFMEGLHHGGVASVAKHFPGRGNSRHNPHFELPRMSYKDLAELRNNDLDPFRGLIAGGVDGILTSHVLATPIDRERPVTLSPKAISGLLRGEMGYDRLVLTDDVSFMMGILMDETGRMVRDRDSVVVEALEAGHDMVILGRIYEMEDPERPERTLTLQELDRLYTRLYAHFQGEDGVAALREKVRRIVARKLARLGPEALAGPPRPTFDRASYARLLEAHEPIGRETATASVVLLSEDGQAVNGLEATKYFADGVGPLSKGVLLSAGDQLTVVSSAFTPPDRLHESILREWIPARDVSSVHMVHGWGSPEALEEASFRWGERVERFSWADAFGRLHWNEEAIAAKVEEILRVSDGSEVVVMAVTRLDQIEILRRVATGLAGTPTHLVVLAYREPYLLPAELYERRRVTVLYLSLFPRMDLAAEVLFGRVAPRPLAYVPVSVPGIARREIDLGAPLEPFAGTLGAGCAEVVPAAGPDGSPGPEEGDGENGDGATHQGISSPSSPTPAPSPPAAPAGPPRVPFLLGLAPVLLGSGLGGLAFLYTPARKFAKATGGTPLPRFNREDIYWTLVTGLGGVVLLYLLGWLFGVFPIPLVRDLLGSYWKLFVGGCLGGLVSPPVCRQFC